MNTCCLLKNLWIGSSAEITWCGQLLHSNNDINENIEKLYKIHNFSDNNIDN